MPDILTDDNQERALAWQQEQATKAQFIAGLAAKLVADPVHAQALYNEWEPIIVKTGRPGYGEDPPLHTKRQNNVDETY